MNVSDIRPILDDISDAIGRQDEASVCANARMLVERMQMMSRALTEGKGAGRRKTAPDEACRDGARMLATIGSFMEAADALKVARAGLCAADAAGFALDEFLCRIQADARGAVSGLNYEQRCWALGVLGETNRTHEIALDAWQTMMRKQYNNKR
jgi:hypothetical protein